VMTLGHLLLATLATGYILAGIWFEERDARRDLGERYRAYAARVPALIPRPGQAGRRAGQAGRRVGHAGRQAASFGAGAGGRQEPGT